jgi:hypothetical protein
MDAIGLAKMQYLIYPLYAWHLEGLRWAWMMRLEIMINVTKLI